MIIPVALPLVVMVQGSFAGQGWGNYAAVLAVPEFVNYFRNSAIIAGVTITLVYVTTVLAAFGFSKLRIPAKELFFWLLLAALTLPEAVLLTPLFTTVSRLGLYNTYISVIVPIAALQIPFTVLLTRNFVNGIPNDLFDAARVDGASTWQAFRAIIVPLARPIAAAIVILTLISTWNAYLLPLVFLQDPSTQTITLVPQLFISQFTNDQTKVLASAVLTSLPTLIAYLAMQGMFERGLSAGALK